MGMENVGFGIDMVIQKLLWALRNSVIKVK